MFFWPRKTKKAKALFETGLLGKGIQDRLDVPVAVMVPMVSMMMADEHQHDAELECIYTICTASPIFLNPSRRHISGWMGDAQKFIRDEGGDEKACRAAKNALSVPLRETAFAFAVKVLFADEKVKPAERSRAEQLATWLDIESEVGNKIISVISILRHGRDAA